MKISFSVLIFFLLGIGCSSRTGPLSGCYKMEDQDKYAVVLDSTLYLMCGNDSASIYDLKYKHLIELNDSLIVRMFGVLYSESLDRRGYGSMECPIVFTTNEFFGGLVMVAFENYDTFYFGGYCFNRQGGKAAEEIFNKWTDLTLNNTQTKLFRMIKD